ncbi:MAG: hypothetical protein ACPLZA_04585, partial [Thermodesulfovibrio sp.]
MIKSKKILLSGIIFLVIGITVGLIIASKFDIQNKGFSEDYKISKESQEILSKISNASRSYLRGRCPRYECSNK